MAFGLAVDAWLCYTIGAFLRRTGLRWLWIVLLLPVADTLVLFIFADALVLLMMLAECRR